MHIIEILPSEFKLNTKCIWCKKNAKKNRAHIISKKLTLNVSNAPILKFSVCARCNSICGKLEEWVLSRTPLSWVKLMLYIAPDSKATSGNPSYYFSSVFDEWVVFNIYANKEIRNLHHVKTQFIIKEGKNPILLAMELISSTNELIELFRQSIKENSYILDINDSLPNTFSPRILLHEDKVILIVRDENQEIYIKDFMSNKYEAKEIKRLKANPSDDEIHFKWSKVNWIKFCAKSAFEALCLFEGSEKCLKSAFDEVRKFVLSPLEKNFKNIVFDKKGPRDNSFLYPIHVDLTNNAPEIIKAILPEPIPGTHEIILYEVKGWIVTSVIFAGFSPVVLILSGPNETLNNIYKMHYDYQKDKYEFFKILNCEI